MALVQGFRNCGAVRYMPDNSESSGAGFLALFDNDDMASGSGGRGTIGLVATCLREAARQCVLPIVRIK